MNKRIFVLILIALLSSLLSACGGNANDQIVPTATPEVQNILEVVVTGRTWQTVVTENLYVVSDREGWYDTYSRDTGGRMVQLEEVRRENRENTARPKYRTETYSYDCSGLEYDAWNDEFVWKNKRCYRDREVFDGYHREDWYFYRKYELVAVATYPMEGIDTAPQFVSTAFIGRACHDMPLPFLSVGALL